MPLIEEPKSEELSEADDFEPTVTLFDLGVFFLPFTGFLKTTAESGASNGVDCEPTVATFDLGDVLSEKTAEFISPFEIESTVCLPVFVIVTFGGIIHYI